MMRAITTRVSPEVSLLLHWQQRRSAAGSGPRGCGAAVPRAAAGTGPRWTLTDPGRRQRGSRKSLSVNHRRWPGRTAALRAPGPAPPPGAPLLPAPGAGPGAAGRAHVPIRRSGRGEPPAERSRTGAPGPPDRATGGTREGSAARETGGFGSAPQRAVAPAGPGPLRNGAGPGGSGGGPRRAALCSRYRAPERCPGQGRAGARARRGSARFDGVRRFTVGKGSVG